jgi:hypothetical protein
LIRRGVVALLAMSVSACAARGHIATPGDLALLEKADGLSSAGRITLQGPKGKFSARVVFGVARTNALRIEIPGGTGLRFLLVAKDGRLRADLPGDDAMFEGPATSEVMNGLFGIDLAPKDLVGAILGSPPASLNASWRFESSLPAQMSLRGSNDTRLTLSFDEPEFGSPLSRAFEFGPPRAHAWSLREMSDRLGLTR